MAARGKPRFIITARKGRGPKLFFVGKKFSNVGGALHFGKFSEARGIAKYLLTTYPLLKKYCVRVLEVNRMSQPVAQWKANPIGLLSLIEGTSSAKTLTDAASKRRKNPSKRGELDKAARLLKDFSGHRPGEVLRVKQAPIKRGLVIGTLDGVPYTTIRDGKTEHYLHEFSENARPLLIASSDGRKLGIVGGRFQFTEAGIIDT
jgi:hypothetical protein